jgi:hypothetical protein
MTTKTEMIAKLKLQYPTLKKGSDETGYETLLSEEYEATIAQWADDKLETEAKETASLQAEVDKAELLAKLGITADEAKLLLS